ncbi:MAG: lipopolysaccharide biosynthesis protein [Psychroflexus halocasei]
MTNLKKQSLDGVIWSAVQKFGTLFIAFAANLFLVRLLSPEEFGVVGVLLIFMSFSDVFLDSGFGSALIQKKEVSEIDYSSVFIFNIVISILIYLLLFGISDYVADYFGNKNLSLLLKVQSIVILLNALWLVQSKQLIKTMKFDRLAKITTLVAVFSNVIAVILAYFGFSYWSLVIRSLIVASGNAIFFWYLSNWRPTMTFSFKSIKNLFSFGGFLFLSAIVEKIYLNFQSFIIGKYFSIGQLGYYSQASKLQQLPANTVSQVINQVTFPLYSMVNEEKQKLKNIFRLNIQLLSYLVIPLFLILLLVADDLIPFLFGEKWIESILYFKYLCIFGMILPINTMHTNIIKSLGKGNLYFSQQLVKRVIGIGLIIYSIRYGIKGIMISTIITGFISYFINAYITKKNIKYIFFEQFKDFFINLLPNIIPASFLIFFYIKFNDSLLNLLVNIMLYSSLFLLSSYVFKNPSFKYFLKLRK